MTEIARPEGWVSKPFPKAVSRYQSRGGKLKTAEYDISGKLPVVDQGQSLIVGYCSDESRSFQGPYPIIVFGDHTRNVKLVDISFAVGADGVVLLGPTDRNELDIKFLYHWLKYVPLHNLGYSRHFKLLNEEQITFPIDITEQRRIVARIEALTRRAEEARKLRREAIEAIDNTVTAFLDQQLYDLPKNSWKPIGNYAKLQGGYAFKSEWFSEEGIRLLRNQNIYHDVIDWSEDKTVRLPVTMVEEFDRFILYEGDIVLTMDRPLIKSGLKASRIRPKDLPCLLLQRVGRFLCSEEISKDYLFHCLRSQVFTGQISGSERSNAVPHISSKQVEGISIPIPELAVQLEIVEKAERFKEKIDQIQSLQNETFTALGSFQSALLAKAFRGNL